MDVAEAIRTRRSIGAFSEKAVEPELILELLETAVWVPNHRMTEPWRFVLLTGTAVKEYANIRKAMALEACALENEATRRQVGEGTYQKFSGIPAFLAIIMTESANDEIREEDFASCAALTQNFLLLAWERGLGTSWKTFKQDDRLRALLGLADDERVVGWLHVGYPNETPVVKPRTPAHERLTVISTINSDYEEQRP